MNLERILAGDNAGLLEQGLELLASIDAELYAKPEPAIADSSIGGHVRHVLDHYASFFAGGAELDYDRRERDPELERSPGVASRRIVQLVRALRGQAERGPADVHVKLDTGHAAWSKSCVARELQFLASHTVHHFALIGVILRLNGVAVPATFGVAPSTLRYREALRGRGASPREESAAR